jgi:hypothetical protein
MLALGFEQCWPLGAASGALAPGAEKAVTDRPHVNTQHCSMLPEISGQLKVCMARTDHISALPS